MLSVAQIADIVATAIGREITLKEPPLSAEMFAANANSSFHRHWSSMEAKGEAAIPFSQDVASVTGRPAVTLWEWFREHQAKCAVL
jgi:hypothetical protein